MRERESDRESLFQVFAIMKRISIESLHLKEEEMEQVPVHLN